MTLERFDIGLQDSSRPRFGTKERKLETNTSMYGVSETTEAPLPPYHIIDEEYRPIPHPESGPIIYWPGIDIDALGIRVELCRQCETIHKFV